MPRKARPKRPPHPARLCLTAPAGPTSPAPSTCREGRGEGKAGARFKNGMVVIAPEIYAPRLRAGQALRASINRAGDGTWMTRCYIAGETIFAATGIDSFDAAIDQMGFGARHVVPDEIQRPGEIGGDGGGQGAGKPGKGGRAIKDNKRAARHVAKVATARDGRKSE